MSYRDLFKFTEVMRSLGYHQQISMDSFHSPNFSLVSEILFWLAMRFEPDTNLPQEIETSEQRVYFIRSIVEFFVLKTNVKLNVKKLYQADRNAVGELLKITELLNDALNTKQTYEDEGFTKLEINLTYKANELKTTRELASKITQKGAALFRSLEEESELRPIRDSRVNAALDINEVEQSLKTLIQKTKKETEHTTDLIKNISATEANLDAKIAKRREDLERNSKRLQTLKQVRPAFLEEFEDLESELRNLYQEYITRQRCISYLEHQQEQVAQAELIHIQEQQEMAKKIIENNKQDDDLKLLEEVNNEPYNNQFLENTPDISIKGRVSSAATSRNRGMFGRLSDSETDSDLMLDDEEDSNIMASDGELSTSRAEKLGSIHSDSVDSDN
ncbi:clusterin-associated protein 1 [Metopolophium dirhodum]|uniref:clusterin-associated protein 1 n=1 Tax=Metopolophium dirhodum TaxID=44670 RepID=UPI00298FA938|nr:clusterin-associated protein 1 [Metopolophium dirhodum]